MTDRTLVATPDPDEPKPYAQMSFSIGQGNTAWQVTAYTTAQTWTGTSTGHFGILRSA